MLPRTHRLRSHEAAQVVRRGALRRGRFLSAKVLPSSLGGTMRAAVVVSKKVAKTAVMRNRIRRTVYTIVREMEQSAPPALVAFMVSSLPPEGEREAAFRQDIMQIIDSLRDRRQ